MRGELQAKLYYGGGRTAREGPIPGRCAHWTPARELIAVVRLRCVSLMSGGDNQQ